MEGAQVLSEGRVTDRKSATIRITPHYQSLSIIIRVKMLTNQHARHKSDLGVNQVLRQLPALDFRDLDNLVVKDDGLVSHVHFHAHCLALQRLDLIDALHRIAVTEFYPWLTIRFCR